MPTLSGSDRAVEGCLVVGRGAFGARMYLHVQFFHAPSFFRRVQVQSNESINITPVLM